VAKQLMHLIRPAIGLCFGFLLRWWLVVSKLAKRVDVQTQASIVKGWNTMDSLGLEREKLYIYL
jgi:hypothetical protein